MSLTQALTKAKTEEDVKDAYIKALGLKGHSKGLIDIQSEEIWFEAKGSPTPSIIMFGQLLFYIRAARKNGEHIPAFLSVIDTKKAALLATDKALPILDDKSIKWPKSGSQAGKELAVQIAPYIEAHFVEYEIATHEAAFIRAAKSAIKEGRIIRTPITPDNLRQVFDKWVAMIGQELGVEDDADYAVLFFADIMHDGKKAAMRDLPAQLIQIDERPAFLLKGKTYELASERGYRNFWMIYHRPPEEKDRGYLLERRDSLLPIDERSFKGAYYTPLHIVDKAYDQLAATLGKNWQQRYIVWDMCCGVGNLEVKHSNYRNIFMSTLDQDDVTIMRASQTCLGAEIFQYDYLNDDVDDFGNIDYTLTNKVPPALQQAIADANAGVKGAKKILVLINPPYGESGSGIGKGDTNKIGVEKTMINALMKSEDVGYASKELFVQFLMRIRQELPNSIIAMFSTLKYVNSPNFEKFRVKWKAKFLGGFAVHSQAFDGMKGHFPIGFLLWDTSKKQSITSIEVKALDKSGRSIGNKRFEAIPTSQFLNSWMDRPVANGDPALPLSNALTVSKNPRQKKQCDGSIGFLYASNNDLQHASMETCLTSSIYTGGNGGGYFVTPENLWQAAIVFAVRRLIKPTWLNDRDQFLQPSKPLTDTFKSDCLVWMLFNGSNLSAGADGLHWNNKDWSLTNHFIPFTQGEVGAKGRFASDFMSTYIAKLKLSSEAKAVMDEGRILWRHYHASSFPRKIRDEYKLNRADAGWYQIRKALEANSENALTDFAPFKAAYAVLSDKLRPMVFDLGFLPE
jgi:hypothetical protein